MNKLNCLTGMVLVGKRTNQTLLSPLILRGVTLALSLVALSLPVHSATQKSWQFDVYLDDKAIGEHSFVLQADGQAKKVQSQASFDVKVLFFNAFSYRHQNTEIWQGNCLQRIDAVTRMNGETSVVAGERLNEGFHIGSEKVGECVSTFAYWDEQFLLNNNLLNSQTGEVEPVQMQSLGLEQFAIQDQTVTAERYRLIVDDKPIELWYTTEGLWLGLVSELEGGRELRYVPKQLPWGVPSSGD